MTDSPLILFAGIDPGARGAIVAIDRHIYPIVQERMPWRPNHGLDLPAVLAILKRIKGLAMDAGGRAFVAIEQQCYRPTDGGKGIFTTGRAFGQLEGMVIALGMPYDTPAPNGGQNGWHRSLEGLPGDDTKSRAIAMVQKRMPDLDLLPGQTRKPHDGLADAGALALYALDRFGR